MMSNSDKDIIELDDTIFDILEDIFEKDIEDLDD